MYSYHNRIKQRINNGELIGLREGSGEFAIVLIFNTPPFTRPIRHHALWRYEYLMAKNAPESGEQNSHEKN